MENAKLVAGGCAAALTCSSGLTLDYEDRFARGATFTTQAVTPFAIEGLTADRTGNLYTTGRANGARSVPSGEYPRPV